MKDKFLSEFHVTIVPSIKSATEAVNQSSFDIALVDYDLDDGKGDEFIAYLIRAGIDLPCIAVSSHENGNSALVKAGAVSVCSKMHFSKIASVVGKINV